MDLSAAVHHQLHHRFLNHNHHHNHQEMDSESLDSIIASSKQQQQAQQSAITSEGASAQGEKNQSTKPRPADEEAQKCPRCDSSNTKFCYYNNYSLTQPRYFCKSCRRYWTKGGTLRNVPVGGGCRKSHKRPSSPSSLLLKRPHHISTSSISTPPLQYGNGGSFDHSLFHHHTHHADVNSHAFSFLDSLRQNGSGLFHGLGYSEVDQGQFAGYGGDVVKQEGGALWGFPWQVMNGGGGAAINHASSSDGGESSYGRGNGLIGNSAWQGFINTPPAALI